MSMHGNQPNAQHQRRQTKGPAAPALAPTTPRKDGTALNTLIRSLEEEWQLGLRVWDKLQSPSQRPTCLASKVYDQIQFLYFTSTSELEQALETFRQNAIDIQHTERLGELHRILKNTTKSLRTPSVTPFRLQGRGYVPPEASKSLSSFSLSRPDLLTNSLEGDPESYCTTAPEPGTPTDEEDEFATPPPSPTLSSMSAQRRVNASSHFQSSPTARKRRSNSSHESGSSPKLTRAPKGKQPFNAHCTSSPPKPGVPLFKKPSLDLAGSFRAASPKSSYNTSVNIMGSFQQSQSETAATSFTSNACDVDVSYPRLPRTRTSSTTDGILDDQDLLNFSSGVDTLRPNIEIRHESSSTFGSIDEDGPLGLSLHDAGSMLLALHMKPSGQFNLSLRRDIAGIIHPSNEPRLPPQAPTSGLSPSVLQHDKARPQISPKKPSPLAVSENTGFSPAKSVPRPPHSSTTNSPSRVPYYIRNIPEQNLFIDQTPAHLFSFPYFILFICCRLSNEHAILMRDLMRGMDVDQVQSDHEAFWTTVEEQLKPSRSIVRDPRKVWSAAKRNHEGYTFRGRLVYNTKPNATFTAHWQAGNTGHSLNSSRVFNLELLPIQAERSCRFQRKFGSDRFLYLEVPPFETGKKKPSRFSSEDMTQIEQYWRVWFEREHVFLGRKWRAFHMKPTKKKSTRMKDNIADKRVVMFATEGVGIDKYTSLGEMMDWFFPFVLNKDQAFCKAYARLDLGLTRTISTFSFKPSQTRYVSDVSAGGTAEDSRFNDRTLSWDDKCKKLPVMNDGCSLMSVGAFWKVWEQVKKVTGSKDPMPSAFQGRIAGAKGVWMISSEPYSNDPAHLEPWIEITVSQRKFYPHEDDLRDDRPYDTHRLTFDYYKHSYSPGISGLHTSFIPILVDRGVPLEVVAGLMTERLNMERDALFDVLKNPVKLYHWVHQQSRSTSTSGLEHPQWQAALPRPLPDRVKYLLESGFLPANEPYLASLLHQFISKRQIWMEQKLTVPLGKATFLFGVADPLGVLQPGEVHIDFSSPFVDQRTGSTFRALSNIDVLVARQPACRRSDIQKVRAVKHPQLAHLVDLAVFPTIGEYPLAGKLQGGDYDGDTFWICWESTLVDPFRNAPAPIQDLDPKKYGIRTDERRVFDVMRLNELSTVDNLIREALTFQMTPSLLGIVTNFLEKQAYKENCIYSDRLNALCDVHDLLVDAPKQGYLFSRADYDELTQRKLRCGDPNVPAYRQAMEHFETDRLKARQKDYKHKKANVLDYLYFDIVREHDDATLDAVKSAFPKEICDDIDLQRTYMRLAQGGCNIVKKELAVLISNLVPLYKKWAGAIANNGGLANDRYSQTVEMCYNEFRAIMPTAIDHPDIKPWLEPYLDPQFKLWEYIRASALYTEFPKRHAFVWHMAGRELSKIKGSQQPGAKFVTGAIFANMKPKPIKMAKSDEDDESEDEFQNALEFALV